MRRLPLPHSSSRRTWRPTTPVVRALIADSGSIVHEWRSARLAQELLTSTLDQYVEEHQPRVLAEASRLFAAVTGGRYERVVGQGDGGELTIVQRDGTTKSTIDLSRGTAEQLYLCLRLSLAAEFAKRGTALPLVMDDVLVDFDPGTGRSHGRRARRLRP